MPPAWDTGLPWEAESVPSRLTVASSVPGELALGPGAGGPAAEHAPGWRPTDSR